MKNSMKCPFQKTAFMLISNVQREVDMETFFFFYPLMQPLITFPKSKNSWKQYLGASTHNKC